MSERPSATTPGIGLVRWLGARLGNPLNWGSLDKCLLACGLILPFLVSYLLLGKFLLARPGLVPFLDRQRLADLVNILIFVSAAWAVLALVAVWLRQSGGGGESQWLVQATIQLYAVSNGLFIYNLGPYTSPVWIVLLGAAMMGFLLFERRAMVAGMVSLFLILGGTTLAERLSVIPYAPLLAGPPYQTATRPSGAWIAYVGSVSIVSTIIMLLLFAHILDRWRDRERRFRELSTLDGLTGITNRRHFMELLENELERAKRQDLTLACVLLDLDHFKQVNDRHGHLVGDQVLRTVSTILKEGCRQHDVVARYGGEEFALLLPLMDTEGAELAAERCRERIADAEIDAGGKTLRVTASMGIACYPDDVIPTPDELIRLADDALYQAKERGRNRIVLARELREKQRS